MNTKTFIPSELSTKEVHGLLLGGVAPRPIAWVSTINEEGKPNLAPFSYFNVFSSNPPILVFSPSRRVIDNTEKDSLHNSHLGKECVINIASHELLGQMVLSSADYDAEVNEFEAVGLEAEPSLLVKPPRVMNAPVQFECKIKDIISLGDVGGAGNMVVCEVVAIHYREDCWDGKPVYDNIDPVARLGGALYTRAKEGLFLYQNPPKPTEATRIDSLPKELTQSSVLNGNQLSLLAYHHTPEHLHLEKNPLFETLETQNQISELINSNNFSEVWKLIYL
jgi:flavin reductase (DIM6/NTAB) family NADH-FMN oxidoreductase RutF